MHFLNVFASLLGVASLTQYVAADLRINADYFSFGGVNFPGLQILEPKERNDVIRSIVRSGARVIRLFSMFQLLRFLIAMLTFYSSPE